MVKAERRANSGQHDNENVYSVDGPQVINGYCKYRETFLFSNLRNVVACAA